MRKPMSAVVSSGSVLLAWSLLASAAAAANDHQADISEARRDANGFQTHEVRSPYQAGKTEIRVWLPERAEKGRRYPAVYMLPVEAGRESRYGDGLREIKKQDLASRFPAIFVAPTFSHLPWYADHPAEATIRQETYLLKVVVPFMERGYPVLAEPKGRLLLGFSKSGWGAFSLLLRQPDLFGRAAAWDAPLNQARPDRFGMDAIFGSQENFEKYRISQLLEHRAPELRKEKRLALLGYSNFREHHQAVHDQMTRLQIPHEYRDERKPRHTWDAGWLADGVRFLLSPAP